MANFILDFWQHDLKAHFEKEETILIPAIKETAFDETLTRRLLNEHSSLRSYIHSLQNNFTAVDGISDFANLLEEHIRFEERIYFPAAEIALNEDQLLVIGTALYESENVNWCMDYPVKFWE